MGHGSAAWGDYDNDGRLDILLTGWDAAGNVIAKVYHNEGSDTFVDIGGGADGRRSGFGGLGRLRQRRTAGYSADRLGCRTATAIAKVYHNEGTARSSTLRPG